MQSVGGSRRSQPFRRLNEAPLEHRPSVIMSLTEAERLGTPAGGQFGWGGTPLKRNRGVEGKAKSRLDWILTSKGSRGENLA